MTAVVMIEAVVIGLLCVLVLGLLRSHAEILKALHDLGVNLDEDGDERTFRLRTGSVSAPVSTPPPGLVEAERPVVDLAKLGDAHDVAGSTPGGDAAAVGVVMADQPTLLAFLSTGCATCQDFWEAFTGGVSLELDGRPVRVVAVTKGPSDESPAAAAELASPVFTTIMSSEAYDDYGVPVSPYFVLVDAHSSEIAGEGAASSWTQLASLLGRAVADSGAALSGRRTRRELLGAAARTARVDGDLGAAGIGPDHPSVRPS